MKAARALWAWIPGFVVAFVMLMIGLYQSVKRGEVVWEWFQGAVVIGIVAYLAGKVLTRLHQPNRFYDRGMGRQLAEQSKGYILDPWRLPTTNN